jgi:hypothetical protein
LIAEESLAMDRQALARPGTIVLLLMLQFIPLLLFPLNRFSAQTQEWWLPVLLAIMVAVANVYLIWRRTPSLWPWYLIAFAQGFNIISRLMLVWPHATTTANGQTVVNVSYVLLSFISIGLSAFMLWYTELPQVRTGLIR